MWPPTLPNKGPEAGIDAPVDTTPLRTRRKDARPGQLLDAALALFVEKGFAATRVEEVASHAGVSKGTLFLYFPSKEDLFKAVVRENISGRFTEWASLIDGYTGGTPELMALCLKNWWERLGATRASGITKLMISEARNFPELAAFYEQEVIRPGLDLLRRVLKRGIERGEFRPIDLDQGVYCVLAPLIYLMMWRHSFGACSLASPALDPERFLAVQLDTLLHGICVAAPIDAPGPASCPNSPPPSSSRS